MIAAFAFNFQSLGNVILSLLSIILYFLDDFSIREFALDVDVLIQLSIVFEANARYRFSKMLLEEVWTLEAGEK